MANLSGRVAIITSASKGIGAAIAEKLAGDGAAVAVNFSNSAREAETVVANIQKRGGRALPVSVDVSKLADVKKLFETTVRAYGRVHVLVTNAAIYSPARFDKADEQLFDRHFSLNVKGLFFLIQEAVHLFGDAGGSIINISSIAALSPIPRASEPCPVPAIFVPLSFPRPLSGGSDNRRTSPPLPHFLAGDEAAAWITGQSISVSGGWN
jgi:3-oxoacyl-[acyl-carrier protein] reductase